MQFLEVQTHSPERLIIRKVIGRQGGASDTIYFWLSKHVFQTLDCGTKEAFCNSDFLYTTFHGTNLFQGIMCSLVIPYKW